jgi:hypothetical protein
MTDTRSGRRLLAEAVVVVVSILMAFTIDAAWDQRQARAGERAVVQSIEADLRDGLRVVTDSRDSTLAAYARLESFVTGAAPSGGEDRLFPALTRQWSAAVPTGALDAATGSGELALNRDPALRGSLARLAGTLAGLKEMSTIIGEMDARTVTTLGEFEGVRTMFGQADPVLDPRTVEALRADPRVLGAATAKLWFTGGYLYQLQLLQTTIEETLGSITDVLAN